MSCLTPGALPEAVPSVAVPARRGSPVQGRRPVAPVRAQPWVAQARPVPVGVRPLEVRLAVRAQPRVPVRPRIPADLRKKLPEHPADLLTSP